MYHFTLITGYSFALTVRYSSGFTDVVILLECRFEVVDVVKVFTPILGGFAHPPDSDHVVNDLANVASAVDPQG